MCVRAWEEGGPRGLFSSRDAPCQAVSCSSWTPHPHASYVTPSIPPYVLCGAHTCHGDRDATLAGNGRVAMLAAVVTLHFCLVWKIKQCALINSSAPAAQRTKLLEYARLLEQNLPSCLFKNRGASSPAGVLSSQGEGRGGAVLLGFSGNTSDSKNIERTSCSQLHIPVSVLTRQRGWLWQGLRDLTEAFIWN